MEIQRCSFCIRWPESLKKLVTRKQYYDQNMINPPKKKSQWCSVMIRTQHATRGKSSIRKWTLPPQPTRNDPQSGQHIVREPVPLKDVTLKLPCEWEIGSERARRLSFSVNSFVDSFLCMHLKTLFITPRVFSGPWNDTGSAHVFRQYGLFRHFTHFVGSSVQLAPLNHKTV